MPNREAVDNEKNYSFTATDGGASIPFEFVMEEVEEQSEGISKKKKIPVKLGDGTFGCVYHVRGVNKNYALKIFFVTAEEFIEESQKLEMSIGSALRNCYIDKHEIASAIDQYLVVPVFRVDNFTKTKAYDSLKEHFSLLSLDLSDKAIVMDFYPMSLKDLLERGWPAAPTHLETQGDDDPDDQQSEQPAGRGAGGSFGERPGYSILRSLSQSERENCILPFIQDIAEGLSILHQPGYRHQDIKPANVLVRRVGKELRAAISDLGFIDSGRFQAHGSIAQYRPIGTRHYRSPEQTDSYDICEVDIKPGEGNEYVLTTKDPKFAKTFSEDGDLVVFAKFDKPYQWEITGMEFPGPDDQDKPIRMTIKGLDEIKLNPDQRTQVTIHKKQTVRTDLFGLGAIIYDMLTCGRSPEQFYDLLRSHDQPGESLTTGLLQRYLHFRNGGGTVPEVDAVFQSLRVDTGSEYPSHEIVSIILRCMLSRPDGSYSREPSSWDAVKKDLSELITARGSSDYRRVDHNYLTNPMKGPGTSPAGTKNSPLEELRKIQMLSYDTKHGFTERIVLGKKYFEKVADMVKKELEGDGGEGFNYLVDMSPENLDLNRGDFLPKFAFFEKFQDLETLLSSDNPKAVLQAFSAGNLLPPFMNALVRDCEVWRDEKSAEENPTVFYDPWGPDHGWPGAAKGDRLSIDLSATETLNATIEAEEQGSFSLTTDDLKKFGNMNAWQKFRAVIVRQFLPSDYYIAMLGIYIRLIFFVNPTNRRQHLPRSIFSVKQELFGGKPKIFDSASIQWKLSPEKKLFRYLTKLYLRLITRQVIRERKKFDVKKNDFSLPIGNAGEIVEEIRIEFSRQLKTILRFQSEEELRERGYLLGNFPDIDLLTEDLVS